MANQPDAKVYYSSSQQTLIAHLNGKLLRVSIKDKLYSEQPCMESAIIRWIDNSFEQKDEKFADEIIEHFSTLIKPQKNLIGWLFRENPNYFSLPDYFRQEINERFVEKYGREVLNNPGPPIDENISYDFSEMVQWYADRVRYPEGLQVA